MSEPSQSEPVEIHEGQAPLPWWGWGLIALSLVYAFLIGPFNWLAP